MAEQGVLLKGDSWTRTLVAFFNSFHMPRMTPAKGRGYNGNNFPKITLHQRLLRSGAVVLCPVLSQGQI